MISNSQRDYLDNLGQLIIDTFDNQHQFVKCSAHNTNLCNVLCDKHEANCHQTSPERVA